MIYYFSWFCGLISPGLTHAATFSWRLNWSRRSNMASVICLAAGAGWQLGQFSSMWLLRASKLFYSGFCITSQSWGNVLSGWTQKLEGVLKPKFWNLCNIISTTFFGSKQATSSAQIQASGGTFHLWLGRAAKITLQRRSMHKGRNLWPLNNLPHFGRTPIYLSRLFIL